MEGEKMEKYKKTRSDGNRNGWLSDRQSENIRQYKLTKCSNQIQVILSFVAIIINSYNEKYILIQSENVHVAYKRICVLLSILILSKQVFFPVELAQNIYVALYQHYGRSAT